MHANLPLRSENCPGLLWFRDWICPDSPCFMHQTRCCVHKWCTSMENRPIHSGASSFRFCPNYGIAAGVWIKRWSTIGNHLTQHSAEYQSEHKRKDKVRRTNDSLSPIPFVIENPIYEYHYIKDNCEAHNWGEENEENRYKSLFLQKRTTQK